MVSLNGIEALPAPARGFPTSEFESRVEKAQAGMAAINCDILLLMTEPEVRYFSGFQTQFWQSPTRPWFLLLPASGKPVAVIPSIGTQCMGNTWIEDIRTWPSPHADDDGVTLLGDTIRQLAGERPAIGLLMGRETHLRMPLADFQRMKDGLAGAKYVDATALVQELRCIKSEAETDKIRQAAQIASAAFDRVPEVLTAGMSEIEAFRAFKLVCLSLGADDPAYLVGGAGSGGYSDIISPPSDRKLQKGDILILDTGCVWDGYYCDFDRNFAVGQADDAVEKAHEIVWQATEVGLKAAQPGATCSGVFAAMHEIMAPHARSGGSIDGVGRLGHGLGMQLTEFPSLAAFDQTVLAPGMVLTLEPGYAFAQGKMMVHEENIVIREDGAELLSKRAARQMPIII